MCIYMYMYIHILGSPSAFLRQQGKGHTYNTIKTAEKGATGNEDVHWNMIVILDLG